MAASTNLRAGIVTFHERMPASDSLVGKLRSYWRAGLAAESEARRPPSGHWFLSKAATLWTALSYLAPSCRRTLRSPPRPPRMSAHRKSREGGSSYWPEPRGVRHV